MTFVGIMLSAGKKKRMQVYSELYEFNEQLILNLKYSRDSVDKVAQPFKFVTAILKGEKVLQGQESEIIGDYLNNLGATDALSQVDYLSEKKQILKKYKEESADNYKKYGSLYVKIFFMVGVMIAVLLA